MGLREQGKVEIQGVKIKRGHTGPVPAILRIGYTRAMHCFPPPDFNHLKINWDFHRRQVIKRYFWLKNIRDALLNPINMMISQLGQIPGAFYSPVGGDARAILPPGASGAGILPIYNGDHACFSVDPVKPPAQDPSASEGTQK